MCFLRRFCVALLAVLSASLRANDPGGGAAGVGANVTLATTSTTATLDNGVIQAVIEKTTGKISSYKLNGTQMVDTANPIYYSMDGGSSYEQPSGCAYSVVSSSTDHIEISCKRTWNSNAGYKHVFDIDLHYVLRRGDTGLYAFALLDHPAAYPAGGVSEWRIVWKLPRSSTTFTFERAYVDAQRNGEMPSYYDYQQAQGTGIAEIVKLTTGVRSGLYDGKYSYAARYFDIGTWGHASNVNKKGVWFVLGGHDYFNDGPTKQDLTIAGDYLLMHFGRNHYDGSSTSVAAGETWRKLYGPFLLYCNANTASSNAGDALWADAQAQVAAEKAAWPYAWLATADHPAASGRGTVTGQLVITDPLKPTVSAANAYVGLAPPEDTNGHWQYQSKTYQYWTRADASGNFTLPGVRPGTYTLYAYNDGAFGEFSQLAVTVTAGATNSQGTLTWTIPRTGANLAWEIGTPDRTAKEFFHGNDYFTAFLWNVYPAQLSNPLNFNVGTSAAATGWNYVHSVWPVTDGSGDTTYTGWDWNVNFNLPAVPPSGNATLTVAIAASNYARLWLYLNDETASFTRITPGHDGGNALYRQGIHAKYSFVTVSIPVSRLRLGANTFRFNFSGTDQSTHVMYDYLGLELPAIPPPPPSSGKNILWKGGANAAANTWDNATTASFLDGANAASFGTGDAVTFDSSGSNTTSVTLTGSLEPNSVNIDATKDYAFTGAGSLTGQMGLTKSGSGKLTLSSANSFAGPTVLNAGILTFGNDAANGTALGTSDLTLNGGTLQMSYSSTTPTISGPWDMDVPSGATATFKPAWRSTISGKLTGGGTLEYVLPNGSSRAALTGNWAEFSGRVNATTGTFADFRMALDYAWPGLPNGSLYLGPGLYAYYSGNLNSGAGTFVSFGELSGAATASLKGGTVGGRQVTYRIGALNTDATFAGTISEQANGFTNLVKRGSGVWTLSGASAISGTTTVEAGTLRVTGSLAHGAAAAVTVAAGASLEVAGSLGAASLTVSDGAVFSGPGTLNASLTNNGSAFCPSGTLTVNGAVTNNGLMRLTGGAALAVSGTFANNGVLDLFDGNPTLPAAFVNNGIVLLPRGPASLVWKGNSGPSWDALQTANWLNGAAGDVFRSGDSVTFDDTASETDVELSGPLAPAAVTVNTSASFSFDGTGTISGTASLTKQGPGLAFFALSHPLTGPVNVSGGTLQLGAYAGFHNTSSFTVSPGASLDVSGVTGGFTLGAAQTLAGSGTILGPVNALGTVSPGNNSAETLAITGNLVLTGSTPLAFQLGTTSDRLAVTGNLTLGGQLTVTAATGFGPGVYTLITHTGSLAVSPGGLTLAAVPEGFDYALSTATPGEVRLVVSSPPLSWRGDGSSNLWDVGVTATFWNGLALTAFANGVPVVFDASGSANPTVNLSGTVSPATVSVNNTAAFTFAGPGLIGGSGSLTKSGSGTLTLGTANTFSGGSTINAGTLTLGNISALGTGAITLNGGTLATGALTPANAINVTADSTISGGSGGGLQGVKAISGTGTLTLLATNVFDLEGTLNGFTGTVLLTGTSNFRLNGSNGSTAASFDLGTRPLEARNNGTCNLGSLTGQAASRLAITTATGGVTFSVGANNSSTTFAGAIVNGPGTVSLTKVGTGTLILSGAATHTGNTTISGGALQIGAGDATGSVSGPIVNNASLIFDRSDAIAHAGLISGTGSLTKQGAGILVLSAANTFAGGTTVSGGTLQAGSTTAFGPGAVAVNTGAAVSPGGFALANAVTVATGGTLTGTGSVGPATVSGAVSPGGSPAGRLQAASLTLGPASSLVFNLGGTVRHNGASGTYDALDVTGALILDGTVTVALDVGFTPSSGHSFQLISAGSLDTSSFATATDLALPALPSTLGWNTSAFASTGTVSVVTVATPFQLWTSSAFSPAQQADPLVSGPDSDPDGDGLSNTLEYALGSSPLSPDSASRLPAATVSATNQLVLAYRRPSGGVSGVAYAVEKSSALGATWDPALPDADYTQIPTPNGDGTETVTITSSAIVSSGQPLFLRLAVTVP